MDVQCDRYVSAPTSPARRPLDRHPAVWMGHLLMVVPIAAAVLKLADLAEFRASLDTWTVLPPRLAGVSTIAIPLLELIVSTAWYLGLRRMWALAGWCAMLFVYTGGYLMQWVLGGPPDCGCLGAMDSYFAKMGEIPWLLTRNTILAAATLGCVFWLHKSRQHAAGHSH